MKIEIIKHYAKDDKDFCEDYYSITVKINGKKVRHYGDYYHDKGKEKAEAFIDGICFWFGEKVEPIVTKNADGITG